MIPERDEPSDFRIETDARCFRLCAESVERASRARGLLADYIRNCSGAAPEACSAAELIVGELLGNVVRHAPGPFELLLEWEAGAGVLRVMDSGPGFVIDCAALPSAMAESARGLYIVLAFGARELRTYRAADGRNVTRVVLPL